MFFNVSNIFTIYNASIHIYPRKRWVLGWVGYPNLTKNQPNPTQVSQKSWVFRPKKTQNFWKFTQILPNFSKKPKKVGFFNPRKPKKFANLPKKSQVSQKSWVFEHKKTKKIYKFTQKIPKNFKFYPTLPIFSPKTQKFPTKSRL